VSFFVSEIFSAWTNKAARAELIPQLINSYEYIIMSITVRLWSEAELKAVDAGNDWLLTLLANKTSFSQDEMKVYMRNIHRVKEYVVNFDEEEFGQIDGVIVKAACVETLKVFLRKEYTVNLASLTVHHKVTKYEEIEL
jgi:hypothetical protein